MGNSFFTRPVYFMQICFMSLFKKTPKYLSTVLLHLPNRNHLRRTSSYGSSAFSYQEHHAIFRSYSRYSCTRPSCGSRIHYRSHRSSDSDSSPDCRRCGLPCAFKSSRSTRSIRLPMPFDDPDCPDIQKVPHSNGTPRAQAAYAHMHSQ